MKNSVTNIFYIRKLKESVRYTGTNFSPESECLIIRHFKISLLYTDLLKLVYLGDVSIVDLFQVSVVVFKHRNFEQNLLFKLQVIIIMICP